MKQSNKYIWYLIIPPILTFLIILTIYRYAGYAPFGNASLAAMDANIQYLDFFPISKMYLLEITIFFIHSVKH